MAIEDQASIALIRTVDRSLHGVRIDSFLVRLFRNYTPFRMQRIVRAGAVSINGETATLDRRVFRGERVSVRLIEPPDKLIEAEPLPLEVLYEDEAIIAVNKPAGMVAHPVGAFQSGTLAGALQHHFDRHSPLKGLLRPGIVHRLDRETSGVMVVSKDHRAHRRLSIDFQRNRVEKSYLALVEGHPADWSGSIALPIGRLAAAGSILMSAAADARRPRPARTDYEVVERFAEHTLLRATPRTGRIHQIRVHLAAIGHPVAGDEFYGAFGAIKASRFELVPTLCVGTDFCDALRRGLDAENPPARSHAERGNEMEPGSASPARGDTERLHSRHALHAERLAVAHPVSGERLEFTAPLPRDVRELIERARGSAGPATSRLAAAAHAQ